MNYTNYPNHQNQSAQVEAQLIHAQVVDLIDKSPNSHSSPKGNRKSVHLQLLGNGSALPFIGVHAVPNRLPELLRYPGESAEAFSVRALHHVTGPGALWAKLMYANDGGGVEVQGTPTAFLHTGRSNRDILLAGQDSGKLSKRLNGRDFK